MKFIICAHNGHEELHFTGLKFATTGDARKYTSKAAAKRAAVYLVGRHPVLANTRVTVRSLNAHPAHRPKVRTNPSGYKSALNKYAAELDRADDLLQNFSGRTGKEILKVRQRPIKTGLVIGKLEGVMYSSDRGEGSEKFFHRFRKSSRPLLIADSDGSQIGIVGGQYQFTERGIEDK